VVRLSDKGQPGNPAVPMGLILNAQTLDPGSYKVSVTALDETGHQFTRTAPITIVN